MIILYGITRTEECTVGCSPRISTKRQQRFLFLILSPCMRFCEDEDNSDDDNGVVGFLAYRKMQPEGSSDLDIIRPSSARTIYREKRKRNKRITDITSVHGCGTIRLKQPSPFIAETTPKRITNIKTKKTPRTPNFYALTLRVVGNRTNKKKSTSILVYRNSVYVTYV